MNTDIKLIYDGIGKWYVYKGTELKGRVEVSRKRLPTLDGLVTFADRYYASIGKTRIEEEHFEDIVQQVFSLLSEPQLAPRCACCDSPDCIAF